MSKTAEGLNPNVYGIPTNEASHRSDLTKIPKTNEGNKQIGWVFEDGQLAGTKDCTIVGARKKDGRPILNETEEMSRPEIIWQKFEIIKKEMKDRGDNRHLFLLEKGTRIEGSGVDYRFKGWAINDWLVCLKPKSKGVLNVVYSFSERGGRVFGITYRNKFGDKKSVNLSRDTGFCSCARIIDLNRLKGIGDLEEIINPPSTKG